MYSAALRGVLGIVMFALSLAAQAATTIVLNAVSDNSIYSEDSTLSDGAGPFIWVGQINNGGNRRALVRFDLSSVPPDVVVTGARLRIFMSRTRGQGREIGAYRLTASWGEGTSNAGAAGTGDAASPADATWQYRFFGAQTPWTTPGGDFVPGPPSATSVTGFNESPSTWSGNGLASDVRLWLASPELNFGWILIGFEEERSATRFSSRNEFGGAVLELDVIPASANVPILMAWFPVAGLLLLGAVLKARR
jgi:hypothetical protein